jgi:hypothetical protein
MDDTLVESLIDRDWPAFFRACRALAVGTPERHGQVVRIRCMPSGTDTGYLAVLDCHGYNAVAPLLDFANPDDPHQTGREWWPNMANAPFNNIEIDGRHVPIVCVKGTRGYHLHPSHCTEAHDRSTWHLVASATLIHRLLHTWGPHQGRGV